MYQIAFYTKNTYTALAEAQLIILPWSNCSTRYAKGAGKSKGRGREGEWKAKGRRRGRGREEGREAEGEGRGREAKARRERGRERISWLVFEKISSLLPFPLFPFFSSLLSFSATNNFNCKTNPSTPCLNGANCTDSGECVCPPNRYEG